MFRPSTGQWFMRNVMSIRRSGLPGDVPVPGDYDGDGISRVRGLPPCGGLWFIGGAGHVQFGPRGDIPVPADYDGDRDRWPSIDDR